MPAVVSVVNPTSAAVWLILLAFCAEITGAVLGILASTSAVTSYWFNPAPSA